jgi:hypothetical protein
MNQPIARSQYCLAMGFLMKCSGTLRAGPHTGRLFTLFIGELTLFQECSPEANATGRIMVIVAADRIGAHVAFWGGHQSGSSVGIIS